MIAPEAIVAAARAELGTPFRHQGRLPGIDLDCAGLSVVVAGSLGLKYKDRKGYPDGPHAGLLESELDDQPCLRRVFRAPLAGDLLLFIIDGYQQHLAICAGDTIIHAWSQPGCVSENRFSDYWKARLVRVYEFTEAAT